MKREGRTCASCREFPLREAAANGGQAPCRVYQRPAAWNDQFCVLYARAGDIEARKGLVRQLNEQQQKGSA